MPRGRPAGTSEGGHGSRGPLKDREELRAAQELITHRYAYVLPDGIVGGPYSTYQKCATAYHKALRAYEREQNDPGY